jgi:hypothetical protein
MARNIGGWRETLADGEKHWRMAKILEDGEKYWRMTGKILADIRNRKELF